MAFQKGLVTEDGVESHPQRFSNILGTYTVIGFSGLSQATGDPRPNGTHNFESTDGSRT